MGQQTYDAIRDYFERHAVPYREIQHAPAAATEEYHQALGCRYEQQAKCLLLKVAYPERADFVIAALPASKRANLDALRDLFAAKRVRLASRDDLYATTGCQFGELAPVARLFGLHLLLESGLLLEDEIYLNAGRLDVSFVISPRDLVRLEDPLIFDNEP